MQAQFTATQLQQKEQLARFLWTGFILMFFGIQAIIWTIAILMTSNDPSHAMVRHFEAKTALPPSRSERLDANRALGWNTQLKVQSASDTTSSSSGQAQVEMTITDRDGSPLELPFIDLTAFHCARAAKVQQVKLSPQQPGVYRGIMLINKEGQWQFDGTIVRDQDKFYFSDRQRLNGL